MAPFVPQCPGKVVNQRAGDVEHGHDEQSRGAFRRLCFPVVRTHLPKAPRPSPAFDDFSRKA
jgi:hypothetical protein